MKKQIAKLLLAASIGLLPVVMHAQDNVLRCKAPDFLRKGDKVALISPAYILPLSSVEATAGILRKWGFEPVIGPNVGKCISIRYAGTREERLSDILWALDDPEIKAVICNRGGYGTFQLIDGLPLKKFSANPKWIVGFSDITTLLDMEACAGVMSIHGTMSIDISAAKGQDKTSTLLRDMLSGRMPRYILPPHPKNRYGTATGTLVGGNLSTFAPMTCCEADATAHDGIILFIEEVDEAMHYIDRYFNMLKHSGALSRCRGVVLGRFKDCEDEFNYGSVENMLLQYLKPYGIPVLCGFPAGHGKVNLPLAIGAPVTLEVGAGGSSLRFDIEGAEQFDYAVSGN